MIHLREYWDICVHGEQGVESSLLAFLPSVDHGQGDRPERDSYPIKGFESQVS